MENSLSEGNVNGTLIPLPVSMPICVFKACSVCYSKCVEHILFTESLVINAIILLDFLLLAQARHILSSVQDFTSTQDSSTTVSEEINYLTLENKSLQNHLVEQQQQYSEKMNEVVSELNNTRKEMVSHAPPISFCSQMG